MLSKQKNAFIMGVNAPLKFGFEKMNELKAQKEGLVKF